MKGHGGFMTDESSGAASTSKELSSTKAWVVAALIGAALLAVVAGVLVVNHRRSDSAASTPSGTMYSSPGSNGSSGNSLDGPATANWMRSGCAGWAQDYGNANGPSDAWCSSMATWMSANGWGASSGQGTPMMGSMMGGNANAMRDACKAWLANSPKSTGTTTPAGWCDQMADWMLDHRGNWGN
jgi:hypothetical protein